MVCVGLGFYARFDCLLFNGAGVPLVLTWVLRGCMITVVVFGLSNVTVAYFGCGVLIWDDCVL